MKELFTTKGFYHDRPVHFTVSKISNNLYLSDCNDAEINRFIVKKVNGIWTSDDEKTQSFSIKIGSMIERTDNIRMQKIQDFVRSCFTQTETQEEQKPPTLVIQTLARM